MKKLIKGIVVVALAAVMLCTTNVMAGTVGFTATLNSDKTKVNFKYIPDGGTFQVITLTGYQYHSGSRHHYKMEGDARYTFRGYGGNACEYTFNSLSSYVYELTYDGDRLRVTATTDNVERGVLYPQ